MAVERKPREKPREEKGSQGGMGMVPVTRNVQRAHLSVVPGAAEPLPHPFPAVLHQGLILGVLLGAGVGLLVGYLLFNGVVALPGWEQLFSMGPFTFHFFWMMMGIAAGILIVGVGTVLAANPKPTTDEETTPEGEADGR